ncbi:hypothetical protein [Bacteroides sp.]|uniref:hypothetical protein n=1 Tax=Bacteroides sp. TaxID=29523 RepID=UPI003A8F7846
MRKICLSLILTLFLVVVQAQKPAVWIVTDMSDKTLPGPNKERTINDPDDISAMAGYLLMSNEFVTRGIVVASTHRKEHQSSPNQAVWVVDYFGKAFEADRPCLEKKIGGYPQGLCLADDAGKKKGCIPVYESMLRRTAEHFDVRKSYSLLNYASVRALFDELNRKDRSGRFVYSLEYPLNVLCWGSLTEPAILVSHCLEQGFGESLKRIRFIAHWTDSSLHQGSPECSECVANCQEDAKACYFLKKLAAEGHIVYYECGAIGQHGIVSGSFKGLEYYDAFRVSSLGTIFVTGKPVRQGGVDDSDSATYYVLLGRWGVTLDDLQPDGTNAPDMEKVNELVFKSEAVNIREELLRRCRIVK